MPGPFHDGLHAAAFAATPAFPALPPGTPSGAPADDGGSPKKKRGARSKPKRARPARRKKVEPETKTFRVIPKHLSPTKTVAKKVSPRRGKKAAKKTARKKAGAKEGPIRIGGHAVRRGHKENILLKISEHYTHQGVYIPVTVIRGSKPGPRIFLTAAVHGDEINGVEIIREAIDRIEAKHLRGTVVAVPVVNRFGFVSHSRYMPDRRDLNRSFPGNATGNTTMRVAHTVFQEIVAPCDYGIDLHTAGYHRSNLPQIRGNMDNPEVRRLAKAFGAEVILDTAGVKGTLRRTATEAGIPTIIFEAGETFRFQRDIITRGVTGVLNVLKELGMIDGESVRPKYQVIVKSNVWVRSDHGGILETLIDAGSLVYKDEVIGHIRNPFGRTVDEVRAPFDGLVVGVITLPMVHPGAPICHMVKLKKTLRTVAMHAGRARLDEVRPEDLETEEPTEEAEGAEEEDIEG